MSQGQIGRCALGELVFTVAEGRASGMRRWALEKPSAYRPFYGVRSTESSRDAHQALKFVPRLRPGECFSHTSALELLGCPIRSDGLLHVSAPASRGRNRTRGVVGHRHAAQIRPIQIGRGLRVAPPVLALMQSSPLLELRELVVAIDALILQPRVPCSIVSLEEVCGAAAESSARGVRKLRRAAALARHGAESRMETLTRLLLAAFGLEHHFVLQREIRDGNGLIGRFDFVCEAARLIIEYDGEQHRLNRVQYLKDEVRLERVRTAGYRVLRLHWEDILVTPGTTAQTIAALLGVQTGQSADAAELLGE